MKNYIVTFEKFVSSAVVSLAVLYSGAAQATGSTAHANEGRATELFQANAPVQVRLAELEADGFSVVKPPSLALLSEVCGFAGCDSTFVIGQELSNGTVNATSTSVLAIVTINTTYELNSSVTVVDSSKFAVGTESERRRFEVGGVDGTKEFAIAAFTDSVKARVELLKMKETYSSNSESSSAIFLNGQCGFVGCDKDFLVVHTLRGSQYPFLAKSITAIVKIGAAGNTIVTVNPVD